MYRMPSSRKRKRQNAVKLNLIPILDAVFIFIFFLLMTASFIKIYEINSDVPFISTNKPPKKKPLALTVQINNNGLTVMTGVPSVVRRHFNKLPDGKYDIEGLHLFMISMKKNNLHEETVILEPVINVTYEDLVQVMDSVRVLKNTDEAIFKKGADGVDVRLQLLFSNVVFGNILS